MVCLVTFTSFIISVYVFIVGLRSSFKKQYVKLKLGEILSGCGCVDEGKMSYEKQIIGYTPKYEMLFRVVTPF